MNFPDRQAFIAQREAAWDKLVDDYHEALPSHPALGQYLRANPIEGCGAEFYKERIVVMTGWDPEKHGSRESIEAAVDKWATDQAALIAVEEAAKTAEAGQLQATKAAKLLAVKNATTVNSLKAALLEVLE